MIGANIAFLGERVRCKIHVEDLYADVERHVRHGLLDRLTEFVGGRFALPDATVDAVLCWHVFDYLDPAAGSVVARELGRVMRPGGVLLAFFGAAGARAPCYTTYVVEDEEHLRVRCCPAPGSQQRVLQNRDIMNLFDHLGVVDSVLRTSGVREVLVRKTLSP